MEHCLVCGSPLIVEIARLENVPSSAQYFVKENHAGGEQAFPSTNNIALQCKCCSHVQSQSNLVDYYKDVISAASLSRLVKERRDQNISYLCDLLGKENPLIIEIGSYKGQYVKHLTTLGYQNVIGMENNQDSVRSGENMGIHMIQGYPLDYVGEIVPKLSGDIILCFNFLEHTPDPFLFLHNIRMNLAATESYFYFTVPSFEYIKQHGLLQELVPDHKSYFTEASLYTLFSRCGMEIIRLEAINNLNDLEIIARSKIEEVKPLSTGPIKELIRSINRILVEASENSKSCAFWGAGHRSLTLISQLKFEYLNVIVDSAEFKQGLICPDTRIKIVSPKQYLESPSDILFLSLPGVYINEVSEFIKESDVGVSKVYAIEGNFLYRA